MRWKELANIVLAMTLLSSPAAAQDDSPAPLTSETLGHLLECKGSMSDLMSYVDMLYSDHPPAWIERVSDNGHPGMISLWTYKLAQRIEVFGHKTDTVSFMNNWIVTELPRADVQLILASERMERAPVKATEQYFHFVDDEKGPMLGAFTPTDDALGKLFGAPAAPDATSETLFIGCNYSAVSKAEFLDAAKQADAIMHESADDILQMMKGQK